MEELQVNDKVHVSAGLINYQGFIEDVYVDEEGYKQYVVNGHLYSRNELKKL